MINNKFYKEIYFAPVCDVLAVEQVEIVCTSEKKGGFDDYGTGDYEWS